MRRTLLTLAILLGFSVGASAETLTGINLKDPYIARKEAEHILFGGQRAKEYLEMMPDGSTRQFPADVKKDVEYAAANSSFGSWLVLASWAVPVVYGSYWPDPWKNFWNQNEVSIGRGVASLPFILTLFQWKMLQDIVGPFFEKVAIQMNKAELEKVPQPSPSP